MATGITREEVTASLRHLLTGSRLDLLTDDDLINLKEGIDMELAERAEATSTEQDKERESEAAAERRFGMTGVSDEELGIEPEPQEAD